MKNGGRARRATQAPVVAGEGTEILKDSDLLLDLIGATEDAVIVCDVDRRILFANRGAERMFASVASEMIGHSIDRFIPEELVLAHQAHMRAFVASTDSSRSMRGRPRIRGRRADGSTFPAEVTISKLKRATSTYLAAVLRDVSVRQREEERFRAILEGTSRATGRDFFTSLVAALGRTLDVRYVVVAELVEGAVPARLRTLAVCEHGEPREAYEYELGPGSPCEQAMRGGTASFARVSGASALSFAAHLSFEPQAYLAVRLDSSAGDPVGLLLAVSDVPVGPPSLPEQLLAVFAARASAEVERLRMERALQRTEESLRQAMKTEALGYFASGIAHDFNNILTIINCAVSAAQEMVPRERIDILHELDQARGAARHGAQLVRKLMDFSRRGPVEKAAVDVGAVVRETVTLLRRVIPRGIAMHVADESVGVRARGDTATLQQSIINLAMNSADAMPEGGHLTFTVGVATLDAPTATRLELTARHEYATVSVRDTGTGMNAETLARATEPFYTTKGSGRGTGLGLPMVLGVLQQVGGTAEITSAPGEGTSVTIYLEAIAAAHEEKAVEATESAEVPRGGSEHVLVVDDEWAVRRVLGRVLEERGYRVSFAADGQEAMESLRQYGGEIALVVSDYQMPRMSGARMYEVARAHYPELRFVMMTGSDDRPLREAIGPDSDRVRLMRKPLDPRELLEVVRAMLDG